MINERDGVYAAKVKTPIRLHFVSRGRPPLPTTLTPLRIYDELL